MTRIRTTSLASLALVLAAVAPLVAQSAPVDSAAVRLAQGKKLFEGKGLCFSCHGAQGEGMLGPTTRLAAGKEWIHLKKGTEAEIAALVRQGLESDKTQNGAAMPSRGGSRMTDAEVELVAAYVQELHKQSPKP